MGAGGWGRSLLHWAMTPSRRMCTTREANLSGTEGCVGQTCQQIIGSRPKRWSGSPVGPNLISLSPKVRSGPEISHFLNLDQKVVRDSTPRTDRPLKWVNAVNPEFHHIANRNGGFPLSRRLAPSRRLIATAPHRLSKDPTLREES